MEDWLIVGSFLVIGLLCLYALFYSQRARTYALLNTADIHTLAEALEAYFGTSSNNPESQEEEEEEPNDE